MFQVSPAHNFKIRSQRIVFPQSKVLCFIPLCLCTQTEELSKVNYSSKLLLEREGVSLVIKLKTYSQWKYILEKLEPFLLLKEGTKFRDEIILQGSLGLFSSLARISGRAWPMCPEKWVQSQMPQCPFLHSSVNSSSTQFLRIHNVQSLVHSDLIPQ